MAAPGATVVGPPARASARGLGARGEHSTCTDACVVGASECFGDAVRTCTLQDTGRADWNAPSTCATGRICRSATCASGCANPCTLGGSQCSGIQIQQCVTDAPGCTTWGAAQDCPAGQTCQGTARAATGAGGSGGTTGGNGGTTGGTGGTTGGNGGTTGGNGGTTGGNGGTTGGNGGTSTALADCRGVVAVRSGSGNYVGWRLKASDPSSIAFNVYRGTTEGRSPEGLRTSAPPVARGA